MKYIINNNRLHGLMLDYLDNKTPGAISRIDSYIILFDQTEYDTYDFDGILLEYDNYDGRLYIYKGFLNTFQSFFPLGNDYIIEFIKEWFESRFDVKINFVAT